MSVDPRVLALLDTVIPASDDMPGAGTTALAERVRVDAVDTPLAAGLDLVIRQLPIGFVHLDARTREAALRALSDSEPAAVDQVVNLVYTAYYTDAEVLARIEGRTGYHAGPPQPRGYQLAPFAPDLLALVRGRGPIWRES